MPGLRITHGAAANAATWNPIADAAEAAQTEVTGARGGYGSLNARLNALMAAGGNISTLTNGVSAAGQKVVIVDSSVGFIAGAYVVYARVGGVLEYNLIADIPSGTQLTLTTNIGTGGIANDSVVAMISASEYAAATVIPYGGTYSPTLPATMGIVSQGIYNVLAYGSAAEAPFLAAIAAIGGNKATLLVSIGVTVTANLTIPATLTLQFIQGGIITVNSGITLTINGPIDAGLYQIFNCVGTGKVVFGGPLNGIYPQWFGAVCDGVTDDAAAIQKVIDCAPITGGTIYFTNLCAVKSELNFSGKTYLTLAGLSPVVNGAPSTGSGIVYTGTSSRSVLWMVGARYMTVKNMEISAVATTPPNVIIALGRKDASSYGNHRFENLAVVGYATLALVYSICSESNTWDTIKLQLSGGGALYCFYTSQYDDLSVGAVGAFTTSTNLCIWMSNFLINTLINNSASASIYVNGRAMTGDYYFRNGIMFSYNGSHIQINVVNDTDDIAFGEFVFDSIRAETATPNALYGIKLTASVGAVTPVVARLSARNLNFFQTDALIYAEDNIQLKYFTGENLIPWASCTYVLDVYSLHDSTLMATSGYSSRVRHKSYGCIFSGAPVTGTNTNTLIQATSSSDGIIYTGSLSLDTRPAGEPSYALPIIKLGGFFADNATKNLTVTQGDGVVTGPKLKSATPGWLFVGMIRINVNDTVYWTPYYSYVP